MPLILGLYMVCWGLAVCRVTSVGCPFRVPRLVLLLLMCRLGEAKNPGPADFILGTFNPSGLKGKAPYIVSQLAHGDIWAISVTNLFTLFGPVCILLRVHTSIALPVIPCLPSITECFTQHGVVLRFCLVMQPALFPLVGLREFGRPHVLWFLQPLSTTFG